MQCNLSATAALQHSPAGLLFLTSKNQMCLLNWDTHSTGKDVLKLSVEKMVADCAFYQLSLRIYENTWPFIPPHCTALLLNWLMLNSLELASWSLRHLSFDNMAFTVSTWEKWSLFSLVILVEENSEIPLLVSVVNMKVVLLQVEHLQDG